MQDQLSPADRDRTQAAAAKHLREAADALTLCVAALKKLGGQDSRVRPYEMLATNIMADAVVMGRGDPAKAYAAGSPEVVDEDPGEHST